MKLLGALLFILALINTLLLAYGFRDFSLQLTAMFLFTVLGLPLSTYLYLSARPKDDFIKTDDDECEVAGRFCIESK